MTPHPYRAPPPAPAVTPRWRAWLRRDHWTRAICSEWQWYRRLAGGVWVREIHSTVCCVGWFPVDDARWTHMRPHDPVEVEHWPAAESGGPR
jgi:hypothetical protein